MNRDLSPGTWLRFVPPNQADFYEYVEGVVQCLDYEKNLITVKNIGGEERTFKLTDILNCGTLEHVHSRIICNLWFDAVKRLKNE